MMFTAVIVIKYMENILIFMVIVMQNMLVIKLYISIEGLRVRGVFSYHNPFKLDHKCPLQIDVCICYKIVKTFNY